MRFMRSLTILISAALTCAAFTHSNARAEATVEDLKKEVEDLRRQLTKRDGNVAPIGKAESALDNRYGPKAPVTNSEGKLQIDGLLHIWSMRFAHDHQDFFGDKRNHAGSGGTDETIDTDGYRIRRAELKFTMDINENFTSVLMFDSAREATSFPPLPSNQGLFKSMRTNPSIATDGGIPISSTPTGRVQTGAGSPNRMLQDAYINIHGILPHHDITIGQFRPKVGEEGNRNDAYLDFVERAMVTQMNELRDQGLQVHGTWFDDRLQYWEGVFDGAGNYFGTAGDFQNRSDDNDNKDVVSTIMFRPFWNCDKWGSLEFGASNEFGRHGEAGDKSSDFTAPVNGLDRRTTAASRDAAWAYYKPMGVAHGMWVRGEWGSEKDRTVPLSVDVFGLGSGPNGEQAGPHPFYRSGWYFSAGYKLSESLFGPRLERGGFFNNLLKPVEFTFRYETFQNIVTEDLIRPDTRTDLYKTNVWIAGVNYYEFGYGMRVQVNYMYVDEQTKNNNQAFRQFHQPNNNAFVFNYQVLF